MKRSFLFAGLGTGRPLTANDGDASVKHLTQPCLCFLCFCVKMRTVPQFAVQEQRVTNMDR